MTTTKTTMTNAPPAQAEARDQVADRAPERVAEREAMVADFANVRAFSPQDPRVLQSMQETPRHRFVPANVQANAYEDRPLPIGHGQTISQPSLVAYMTEQLQPQQNHRVLEIGTGSGYQAAVLAPLVAEVYTIEIVAPLGQQAQRVFTELGYANIHTRIGDGYAGWPEAAPFDAIIVTCAPDAVPPALTAQLREGGRMIIPVGPQGEVQTLYVLEKQAGTLEQRARLAVQFVPMTSGAPR